METSQSASIDALEEHAAGVPSAWLICRARGHNLADHDAYMTDNEQGYVNVLDCRRCHSKRTEVLDLDGHVLSRKYEYPEGYLLPDGTGRIDADGRGFYRISSVQAKIRAKQAAQEARQARNRAKRAA